jgi:uncharacterized protein
VKVAANLLPRKACGPLLEALADTRVVVVNGARQVGKSTLAETVLRQHPGGTARFLDEAAIRDTAAIDPAGFIQHDGLMLIDEVQRVPDLWLAIKHTVDRDPRPGRFLLTGSARLQALHSLPDALVGRSETIELWPLSQGEIDAEPDGFIDAAFAQGVELQAQADGMNKKSYLERVMRGGYPEAVRRSTDARRRQFFAAYLSDLIVRDFQQVAEVHKVTELRRLLSLLAAQTGAVLNSARLSSALGLDVRTVNHYLDILEIIFVIKRIPGWSAGAGARPVKKPKVHFTDSGLAAFLSGTTASQPTVQGGLLKNFVVGELGRQLTWCETQAQLFHFRDYEKTEVDVVIESYAGEIVAVEVKASETARADDFKGLKALQSRVGDRFRAGFLLYCGQRSLSFGDRMAALPVAAVWRAGQADG